MNAKALKALKASIAHWERLAYGKRKPNEKTGPEDCALCARFYANDCKGCPIMALTKMECCMDTPYEDADNAAKKYGLDSHEFASAARIQYNFLRALLPEKQR